MNNHAVPLLSHHKQTALIFLFIVFFYSCAKIKHCWIFDRHLLQRLYHLSQSSSILVHNLNSFGQFCLSYHISLKHSKRCVHQLLCMLCTFSSHGDLLLKKKNKNPRKILSYASFQTQVLKYTKDQPLANDRVKKQGKLISTAPIPRHQSAPKASADIVRKVPQPLRRFTH